MPGVIAFAVFDLFKAQIFQFCRIKQHIGGLERFGDGRFGIDGHPEVSHVGVLPAEG
jgi:hypothetical protein